MSKRSERKARQAAVTQQRDVQLSPQQLMEAAQVLIQWLSAWSTKNWGLMASLTQCRALIGVDKARYVASQFVTNLLVDWDNDIMATKAMADEVDGRMIGYVDFAVVANISNGERMGRFGFFARLVLDGTQWTVNPHSINRRFDPKLADLALKDLKEESDAGAEDQDDAD